MSELTNSKCYEDIRIIYDLGFLIYEVQEELIPFYSSEN